ncbi:hypothetical protein, partial [Falsiroseomonas oryzae]|uniref:hypothetical protein n=1 Tax=Falsiroseomonas oryzae TaxID=2766473 RepID=UPI0022EACC6A
MRHPAALLGLLITLPAGAQTLPPPVPMPAPMPAPAAAAAPPAAPATQQTPLAETALHIGESAEVTRAPDEVVAVLRAEARAGSA